MAVIQLIPLGDIYPLDINTIANFGKKSGVFEIEISDFNIHNNQILSQFPTTLLDSSFNDFDYQLNSADFIVVLVNRELENNYFSRLLPDRPIVVVTIFGIESLNIHEGISYEMYLNRLLLAFSTIYKVYGLLSYELAGNLMQLDTRGCLFDMGIHKPDIAKFFRNPHLSEEVKKILSDNGINNNNDYLIKLERAIKKLEIGSFYKIKDWLKENPMKGLIFTFLISFIFSGLLGNFIYDLIKWYFNIF
jgi:hypothetical protein